MGKELIYLMSDDLVEQIRDWRDRVTQLKVYRAKGYCEICRKPFGTQSDLLKGHHLKRPSLLVADCNTNDNIVICCDYCYHSKLLSGKPITLWEFNQRPRFSGENNTSEYMVTTFINGELVSKGNTFLHNGCGKEKTVELNRFGKRIKAIAP